MKILSAETKTRNGRSYLEMDVSDGAYEGRLALDLTAVYYLMTTASSTKHRRAKRGPLTITRARKTLREAAS